jgi:hypothetical protein
MHFGPPPYGPSKGFASLPCPACGHLERAEEHVSGEVDRVLYGTEEGTIETQEAISERLAAGGIAVPKGEKP